MVLCCCHHLLLQLSFNVNLGTPLSAILIHAPVLVEAENQSKTLEFEASLVNK